MFISVCAPYCTYDLSCYADSCKSSERCFSLRGILPDSFHQTYHPLLHNIIFICTRHIIHIRLYSDSILIFFKKRFLCIKIATLRQRSKLIIRKKLKFSYFHPFNLCLTTSYIIIDAAFEAFNEVILPFMGIDTTKSHFSLTSLLTPEPSPPITRPIPPVRSWS